MPYKREGSPYYQIRRRRLAGYGDTGVLSSKVGSKKLARDMERVLEELAHKALEDASWYGLLDAVCREKTVPMPDLLKARNIGTLEGLKRSLTDPTLTEAVAAYQRAAPQNRSAIIGLRMLMRYAPAGMRLGDLTSRTITKLCIEAEEDGRKRNTVRRSMLRGISLLLRFHIGNAERNRIFADVVFHGENDTREVHLTPAELRRLFTAMKELGYAELGTIVRTALLTSADRGVLLAGQNMGQQLRGLRVRDLTIYLDSQSGEYSGEVFLHDTKAKNRSRSVPLTDSLCRELLVCCKGKDPDSTVFEMKYQQLDFQWKAARRQAGLKGIRFKDLRAQTAIYAEEAGIPITVAQKTLGHSNEMMTRRYQQRAAVLSIDQAQAIESAMFAEDEENGAIESKNKRSQPGQQ
ncbi:MAG: site-specific integrase [Rhodothermales bacterium]